MEVEEVRVIVTIFGVVGFAIRPLLQRRRVFAAGRGLYGAQKERVGNIFANRAGRNAAAVDCVGTIQVTAEGTVVNFSVERLAVHAARFVLSNDTPYVVTAGGRHHADTGDDVTHITTADACCRTVGAHLNRA